jgi:hypothetical protein
MNKRVSFAFSILLLWLALPGAAVEFTNTKISGTIFDSRSKAKLGYVNVVIYSAGDSAVPGPANGFFT